jgi:hypothetical protein
MAWFICRWKVVERDLVGSSRKLLAGMRITPSKPFVSQPRPEEKKTAAGAMDPGNGQPDTLLPYQFGDPIPKAEAVEKDTDTVWAEWSGLAIAENHKFADTAPASDLARLSSDERSSAPTVPAPLQKLQAAPMTPSQRELTVVDVMVEARLNNRVCPMPAKWLQLYEMLPDKTRSEPPPPLVDTAWRDTPSIPKRMCFRQHIEWADSHGVLKHVFAFMKSMPEDEWLHMGE